MMLVYLIFILSSGDPVIIDNFSASTSATDCAAALAVIRSVENEKVGGFHHFCLSQPDYDRYVKERNSRLFEAWKNNGAPESAQ